MASTTTKSRQQHATQADKTAKSLAKIEALMAKSLAVSRRYIPSWERNSNKKSMVEDCGTHANSSKQKQQVSKRSSVKKETSTKKTKTTSSTRSNSISNNNKPAKQPLVQNKTEWKPMPASPKLSSKSATTSKKGVVSPPPAPEGWTPLPPSPKLSGRSATQSPTTYNSKSKKSATDTQQAKPVTLLVASSQPAVVSPKRCSSTSSCSSDSASSSSNSNSDGDKHGKNKKKSSSSKKSSSKKKKSTKKKHKSYTKKHVSFASDDELAPFAKYDPALDPENIADNEDEDESSLTEVDLQDALVVPESSSDDIALLTEADQMAGWDTLMLSHIFEDSSTVDKASNHDHNVKPQVITVVPEEVGNDDDDDGFPEDFPEDPSNSSFEEDGDFAELVHLFDHCDDNDSGVVGEFLGAFSKIHPHHRDPTETTAMLEDDTFALEEQEVNIQEVSTPFDALEGEEFSMGSEEVRQVVVLIATQTANRSVLKNQKKALSILDFVKVDYITVDGTDPYFSVTRDELFELSERRGEYPQFFHVVGDEAVFLGGMAEFKDAMDTGNFGEWITDAVDEQPLGFM